MARQLLDSVSHWVQSGHNPPPIALSIGHNLVTICPNSVADWVQFSQIISSIGPDLVPIRPDSVAHRARSGCRSPRFGCQSGTIWSHFAPIESVAAYSCITQYPDSRAGRKVIVFISIFISLAQQCSVNLILLIIPQTDTIQAGRWFPRFLRHRLHIPANTLHAEDRI